MGAGSTSLQDLSTIAVDGLKIDAALVNGMLQNARGLAISPLIMARLLARSTSTWPVSLEIRVSRSGPTTHR
jgi:EAL domain-containing protein (putative c-di-GMP-specific phosphodiesterase class I)